MERVTFSLASAAMNRASSARPAAAPMSPPRTTAARQVAAGDEEGDQAVTGRIIRARMFQTPVTMTEVEMSRREKPQDRKAA